MFAGLDIACLMDSRYTDGGGIIRTRDRSPKGLNPRLGDGATAGTMPTWDSARGLYTFDGGDSLSWPIAEDVGGVLASIGSLQDETYLFYLSPIIVNSQYQYLFQHNSQVGTSRFFIRIEDTNIMWMNGENAVGVNERLVTGSILDYNRKEMFVAFTRRPTATTKRQAAYINGVEFANDNDVLVDCSNAIKGKYIGVSDAASLYLQNGTGLRFFGYARAAWTVTKLQALQRYLRGVI